MTTVPDSGERIGQEPRVPENTSISRDRVSEDSLKIVSLPLLENDSVGEISLQKQVISSPFTSVSTKDEVMIHSASIEVSISETETMNVDCPGVLSFTETGPTFLEDDRVCGELHQIEESSKLEKKGQDFDAQRLLEAEKRRLLAEVEVGTIFRKRVDVETLTDAHKIEKNGNFSKEQQEKMERVGVKENAFVERSVKIELIDDTALVDVVSFYKKSQDHHSKRLVTARTVKDAPRKHKKIGEKQNYKGNASNFGERNASTKVCEFHKGGGLKEKQLRVTYSRNKMESMRYAHMENQKKLWSDLYARLLPKLVTEYEGLVSLKNQNTSKPNLRDSGIGILGPILAVPRRNRVNVFVH